MLAKQPFANSRIQRRRDLVGTSRAMYGHAAEILEGPESKRFKAINATYPNYLTDIEKKSGLCKQLDNDYYKQELYDIAIELGLAVNKRTSKSELCERLSVYAKEAGDIPMPVYEDEDDVEKLNKANKMLQKSLGAFYKNKRERLQNYDSDVFDREGQNYSRLCQPAGRQPVVVSTDEFNDILDELLGEIVNDQINGYERSENKIDYYHYLANKGSLPYRGQVYLCPFAYCQNDNRPLNSQAEINEHIAMDHVVFTQDSRTMIPGFLPKENSKELCVPCCFTRNNATRRQKCLNRDLYERRQQRLNRQQRHNRERRLGAPLRRSA